MYQVTVFRPNGAQIANLGRFANIPSARQAMLDHSNTIDLPTELPFQCLNIVEGWFVGRTEYNIELAARS